MPKVMIEMEMPKGCRTCKFCRYDHIHHWHYCCLLSSDRGEHVVSWSYKNRDEFCPLQEINE